MMRYIVIIGLILDIFGVILIFIYGIPKNLNPNGYIYKVMEQIDENEIKKYKKFLKRSNFGIILIIIGFLLQFIGQISNIRINQ